jgi:hypothetical protein
MKKETFSSIFAGIAIGLFVERIGFFICGWQWLIIDIILCFLYAFIYANLREETK